MDREEIELDPVDGVVTLRGDFDLSNADALRECLERADGAVTINMAEVTFIDSTAIAALVATHNRGTRVVIVNASDRVMKVLDLCGLTDFLAPSGGAPPR